jgi:hypothetical protein
MEFKNHQMAIWKLETSICVKIVYKNQSEVKNLRIFYTTQTETDWSGSRGENFGILKTGMPENGDWETAVINIPSTAVLKSQWSGTLSFLRFEFGDTALPKPNVAETVFIKEISLIKK